MVSFSGWRLVGFDLLVNVFLKEREKSMLSQHLVTIYPIGSLDSLSRVGNDPEHEDGEVAGLTLSHRPPTCYDMSAVQVCCPT